MRVSWSTTCRALTVLALTAAGSLAAAPALAAGPEVVQVVADGSPVVTDGTKEIRFKAWAGAYLQVDCQTSTGKVWYASLYSPSGADLSDPDSSRNDLSCKGAVRHQVFETSSLPEDGEYVLRFYYRDGVSNATYWVTASDTPAVPVSLDGTRFDIRPAAEGQNAVVTFSARGGDHVRVDCDGAAASQVRLYGPDHREVPRNRAGNCFWLGTGPATVVDTVLPLDGPYRLVFDYDGSWTKATGVWLYGPGVVAPTW